MIAAFRGEVIAASRGEVIAGGINTEDSMICGTGFTGEVISGAIF